MADTDNSYIKQQQLVNKHNQENYPSKYSTNFLYKAVFVVIFLVIVPVFPTQAPEFINQTLLNGSWELLHLLFVGIAVSYGLFSRKNDETEQENNNNHNNVQSFVSRFLQVSSVFDDESENLSGPDYHQNRVAQTWSSQYHRNEPPAFVAKKQGSSSSSFRIAEKPLLLPVRSLKSRVLEANNVENTVENSSNSGLMISRRYSNKGSNGEMGNSVERMNEDDNNVDVLPSPTPWRSSSFRSESTRLSRSPSLSSPKKLSPSPSLSAEAQAKNAEDLVRRKNIYRSPTPLPPPHPPLRLNRKRKDNETENGNKGNRVVRYEETSLLTKPSFMEFPHEEKPAEKVVVETTDDDEDDDSEIEDEEEVGKSCSVLSVERGSNNGIDGGSDVDKKADEFIAKVREQIRLQRIDSIKELGGQMKRNNTR